MQPGDSIIGKMNEGLEDFTTFFFFVSPNSLESKMVSLEWQTALNKAINNNLKFVAVRIADCSIPVIISDKLYIDLYGEGMDDAVAKMKCVVKGENSYKPLEEVKNLQAFIKKISDKKAEVTIKATLYSENNPIIAFACKNSFEEFTVCFTISDGMIVTGKDEITTESGLHLNAYIAQLQRSLKPGFPFVFEVTLNNVNCLHSVCVFSLIDAERKIYQQIPISN